MFKSLKIFFLSCVLLLTACGGGSSSGGGSGSGEVYKGTYSLLLFIKDNPAGSIRGSGTFSAVVNGDSITITFDDGTVFKGEYENFDVVSLKESVVGAVEECSSGTINLLVGRPDGSTISAIVSSTNVVCQGSSVSVSGSLKGAISQ